MKRFANWLRTEESGQGMVEYGLILILASVAAVAALKGLGGRLSDLFGQVTDAFG